MNPACITVSIPLLLVLAGFNHAHGLITFGKTATNPPHTQQQPALMKRCDSQSVCNPIKGTTCLNNYCLCGDNQSPINGACKAELKGPRHICTRTEECVYGAECTTNSTNRYAPSAEKTCQCIEGYIENGYHCSGADTINMLQGLILIAGLVTTLFH